MSDFGDQLRENLARKEDHARAAGQQQEQARQAAEKRFEEAEAAAAALIDDVFGPLLAEFQEVIEAEGLLSSRRGRIRQERPARHRPDFGRLRLIYAARGTATGRRVYEVRLAAAVGPAPTGELAIELTAECLHDAAGSYLRQSPPQPLVELPRRILPAGAIDHESACQWCAEVLKRCAEAIMDANSRPAAHAQTPLAAPVCAVPALGAFGAPATV
jgi:hypothetical protein